MKSIVSRTFGTDKGIKQFADEDKAAIYRGRVVNNLDPKSMGRIKVRIPAFYSNISDDNDLPWCLPNLISASYKSGSFIIPNVNDTVWVAFEAGDKYRPVWIGCVYSSAVTQPTLVGNTNGQTQLRVPSQVETPEESWNRDYKVLYKSGNGSVIYVDDSSEG